MNIDIIVANKIATAVGSPVIVCGNSDYTVTFSFDSEWGELIAKTARFSFIKDGQLKYCDVPFTGNVCEVPVLSNIKRVGVGVYAGDLYTTTGAVIDCKKSILCDGGVNEPPEEDVYNEIMTLFNTKVLNPDVVTVIDNTYNPESDNPQSGKAVGEAFERVLVTYKNNNILNLDDYTNGYIANDGNGNPASSSTLKYSTPMPVVEGDVIRSYRYDASTGTLSPYAMNFVAAYQNGVIKPYHGKKDVGTYTVPANVDSIVITINPIVVHEITKNYTPTEYEEYYPTRTEVKQNVLPVASETVFGVCKIWTSVNEAGENVLNIVTGE